MGNSWKAKCVKDYYGWKKGMIIEVKNGIIVESKMHRAGGLSPKEVQTFDEWCKATNPLSWELIEQPTEQPDAINPSHYNSTKISAFDVIDDWGLDFYVGNVVKYIQRAGKKENNSELQDLQKAQRYLEKKIELIERESDDK